MASGGRGSDRAPQFTESHYEIPSWQIPWNKPWYQWNEKATSSTNKPKGTGVFKYNDRGHVIDCNCTECEDDLDKAFAPQANTKEFNIPKERHKEIDVELLENLPSVPQDGGHDCTPLVQSNTDNPANQANRAKAGSENVILLSDLPEYVPPASKSVVKSATKEPCTSTSSRSASSMSPESTAFMSHESLIDSFDSLRAIQGISNQAGDLQARVQNFRGTKDSKDYVVMRDLLLALQRELGRINESGFEWLHRAKYMAIEAVGRTLQVLEQKVKENE